MIRQLALFSALLFVAMPGTAQKAPCADDPGGGPLAISRAWWTAFATADIKLLEERTASIFSWTASNGRTLDRRATIAKSRMIDPKAKVVFDWKEGSARQTGATSAIVTNRIVETIRTTPPATYRYLSVLECTEGRWRAAVAQSTLEAQLSARVAVTDGGMLDDFAGNYQTPSGSALQIITRGDALSLTDPTGAQTRFEYVGRDLFEAAEVSGAGIIRFVFHRGDDGKVVALSRLASTIVTFPRIEATASRKTRTKE